MARGGVDALLYGPPLECLMGALSARDAGRWCSSGRRLWEARDVARQVRLRGIAPQWAALAAGDAALASKFAALPEERFAELGKPGLHVFQSDENFPEFGCELFRAMLRLRPWCVLETQDGGEGQRLHPIMFLLQTPKLSWALAEVLEALSDPAVVADACGALDSQAQAHCPCCHDLARCRRHGCARRERVRGEFLTCSRCRDAHYCSEECRLVDWTASHGKACEGCVRPRSSLRGNGICQDCVRCRRSTIATFERRAQQALARDKLFQEAPGRAVPPRAAEALGPYRRSSPLAKCVHAAMLLLQEPVLNEQMAWEAYKAMLRNARQAKQRLLSIFGSLASGELSKRVFDRVRAVFPGGLSTGLGVERLVDLALRAEAETPAPADAQYLTGEDYYRLDPEEVLKKVFLKGPVSELSVHVLNALQRTLIDLGPKAVLQSCSFRGGTCSAARGLLRQPWMEGAVLSAGDFKDVCGAADLDECGLLQVAQHVEPSRAAFVVVWTICARPASSGAGARALAARWSEALDREEVASVVRSTPLSFGATDGCAEDACLDALLELLEAPWLVGLRLHDDTATDLLARHAFSAKLVKALRLSSRGVDPADVVERLAKCWPDRAACDGEAIAGVADWLGQAMASALGARMLHGLARSSGAHTAHSVESVEQLLIAFPDTARLAVRPPVAVDKAGAGAQAPLRTTEDRRVAPLQVLCLHCQDVNVHAIAVARMLFRKAPATYEKAFPRALRMPLHADTGVEVCNARTALQHRARLAELEGREAQALGLKRLWEVLERGCARACPQGDAGGFAAIHLSWTPVVAAPTLPPPAPVQAAPPPKAARAASVPAPKPPKPAEYHHQQLAFQVPRPPLAVLRAEGIRRSVLQSPLQQRVGIGAAPPLRGGIAVSVFG